MLKILFLDDSMTRHNFLCGKKHSPMLCWKVHKCHNSVFRVTHVYTAEQAIAALQSEKFDMVCLDHDLTINRPDLNNGLVVAQYIVDMPEPIESDIKIHSWNKTKALAMYELLFAAGFSCAITPFWVA
jgi:hypothetical protein